MIKLIAVDVDGTIVDDDKRLSPDFRKTLNTMDEKGVLFVIASGRSYNSIKEAFPDAENAVIIAYNGAYIRYKDRELLALPLDRAEADVILEESGKIPGAVIMYSGKEIQYIKNANQRVLDEVIPYAPVYQIVEDFSGIEESPLEITLFDQDGAQDNCYKYLASLDFPNSKVCVSGYTWLDVMNKDVDKGSALRIVMSEFGIEYDEAAAFGDNYNDIEMLESVSYSYAMKNSPDDIKRIARFTTEKDNNEFGAVFEIMKLLAET